MVNVDFASPSLLLGAALIGCGVMLLNVRTFQNKVARDADIVVAAMVCIVGSTLIFQGWRLDPLLLLCQALTTSVAFWYGLETFRLRSKEADAVPPALPPGLGPDPFGLDPAAQQQAGASGYGYGYPQQQQQQQAGGAPMPGYGVGMGVGANGLPYLPPGAPDPYYPWGGAAGSSTNAAAASTSYGSGQAPYAETIQYDYYGNPIMPAAEVMPLGAAAAAAAYDGSGSGPYGGGGGYADGPPPYGGGGMPPPQQQQGRWGSAPAGPSAAPPYGEPYALPPATSASAPPLGADAGYGGGPYGPAGGVDAAGGGVGWDRRHGPVGGSAAGGGGAGGVGRAGQVGRLDLYEKVDDWE